ncbi:NAD-dependent epimerase/dehydratase family protein [Candidatus Woesearchaeota archaeon]|nr:NAD-dependent epimerase/dehydratase family protein [Candidatus Woesearchaeota archaeon]
MKVLVTGGTGFIGSNLALELKSQGHEVLITGHDAEQPMPEFQKLHTPFIGLDFEKIGKIDVLFHQAAINDTTFMNKEEMLRANLHSSIALFNHVLKNGCKRIVYASSTAAYGNAPVPFKENGIMTPLNPYGESKKLLDEQAMELAKKHEGVVIVGLRYCNVYGPRENHKGKRASMIFQLAQQINKGNPKIFKWGEQKRDYIYVKDVVKANLLAAKAKQSCVVNCGRGKPTSFNDIIKTLNTIMNAKRQTEYIDNPYADKYQNHTECDMTLAKEKIGFVPEFDIETGIKDYFDSGFLTS